MPCVEARLTTARGAKPDTLLHNRQVLATQQAAMAAAENLIVTQQSQ
jgi:hypothetical protein